MDIANHFGRIILVVKLIVFIGLLLTSFNINQYRLTQNRFFRMFSMIVIVSTLFLIPMTLIQYSSPLSPHFELAYGGINIIKSKQNILTTQSIELTTNITSNKDNVYDVIVGFNPSVVAVKIDKTPSDVIIEYENKNNFSRQKVTVDGDMKTQDITSWFINGVSEFQIPKNSILKSSFIDIEIDSSQVEKSIVKDFNFKSGFIAREKALNFDIETKSKISNAVIEFLTTKHETLNPLSAVTGNLIYNNVTGTRTCFNCTDCNLAINASSPGEKVALANNINTSMSCLYVPNGIQDIIINCNNNSVIGNNSKTGLLIKDDMISVQNCNFQNFTTAINITDVQSTNISNATFVNNGLDLYFGNSQGTIINLTNFTLKYKNQYGLFEPLSSITSLYSINFENEILLTNATIKINSTKNPSLNISANISFYNLFFTYPNIVIDSDDDGNSRYCTSPICNNLSYSNQTGTYKFNITHFTTYSIKEGYSAGNNCSSFAECTYKLNHAPDHTTINLIQNLNDSLGTRINIQRSNINFNGNNYNIDRSSPAVHLYSGDTTIYLENITVSNLNVDYSYSNGFGLRVEYVKNLVFENATFSNLSYGLFLYKLFNSTFNNINLIEQSTRAINIMYSNYNNFSNIVSSNSPLTFYLSYSYNNLIKNINISDEKSFEGTVCYNRFENITSNNGFYFFTSSQNIVNQNLNELYLCNAANSNLTNLIINNSLFIQNSSFVNVTNITVIKKSFILSSSGNSTISNSDMCLNIDGSWYNKIYNSKFDSCPTALSVTSSYNLFENITINNSNYAIEKGSSVGNIISNSRIINTSLRTYWDMTSSSNYDLTLINVTGDTGKPILYVNSSVSDVIVDKFYAVKAVNASFTNITVEGSEKNNKGEFKVYYTQNSNFSNINIKNIEPSWFYNVYDIISTNMTVINSTYQGIKVKWGYSVLFSNLNITNSGYDCFDNDQSETTIKDSSFSNCGGSGVYIFSYELVNITNVTVTNAAYGYKSVFRQSDPIYISNSKFINVSYGIYLTPTSFMHSSHRFYNNYFLFNISAIFPGGAKTNYYNTNLQNKTNIMGGNLYGGNFWASFNDAGYSQTCADDDYDGICDDPYEILGSSINVDNYAISMKFHCNNGLKDYDETAVDCGGLCRSCPDSSSSGGGSSSTSYWYPILNESNDDENITFEDEYNMTNSISDKLYSNESFNNSTDPEFSLDLNQSSNQINEDLKSSAAKSEYILPNNSIVQDNNEFVTILINGKIMFETNETNYSKINITHYIEEELNNCNDKGCRINIRIKAKNLDVKDSSISLKYDYEDNAYVNINGNEYSEGTLDVRDDLDYICHEEICKFKLTINSSLPYVIKYFNISYIENPKLVSIEKTFQDNCESFPCQLPILMRSKTNSSITLSNLIIKN